MSISLFHLLKRVVLRLEMKVKTLKVVIGQVDEVRSLFRIDY